MHLILSKRHDEVHILDMLIYCVANSLISAITEHAVRLELSKEVEEEDPFAMTTAVAEVHASVMISMGMQLEEDQ
jgi:hypothetical protein